MDSLKKTYSDINTKECENCIFCKIINNQIPATIIKENDEVIVIKDLYPQAPIHFLIITKKHISDIGQFSKNDKERAAALLLMAQELSLMSPQVNQFRLIINNGPKSGQTIFHTHVHFLAGKTLDEKI